jgi:hypothetical protein
MWVDENGDIDTNSGCQRTTDGLSFPQLMKDQGYGAETGLFQAVYLQEPAVVEQALDTQQSQLYENGNNIYLMTSQAAGHFWEGTNEIDPTGPGDSPIDNEIDKTLEALQDRALADDANADTLEIVVLGNDFNNENDYHCQYDEDTGGFESKYTFTHQCETGCEGDTVVTGYVFEATLDVLGNTEDGATLEPLDTGSGQFAIGQGSHTWYDVDPFDGHADRNDDTDDSPPTEE